MERLGVIGGTGLIDMTLGEQLEAHGLNLVQRDAVTVETPYGEVPLTCIQLAHGDVKKELIFLQRHHNDGAPSRPPHMIEHRANMRALFDAGCEAVMAVCSVGAIPEDFPPGKVALANQYIDFTGQESTFHDDAAVFTSVTDPFDAILNTALESVLRESQGFAANERMHYTYWLAQGPQFETAAEVRAIEKLGGHVVGMTMPREAKLCREIELPYAALLIGSNWAAGKEPGDASADLSHEAVSAEANRRLGPVWSCITSLLTQ